MAGNEEIRVWGIHTQDDKLFLQDNKIAIGWHDFGNLFRQAPECYIVTYMKFKLAIMVCSLRFPIIQKMRRSILKTRRSSEVSTVRSLLS